MTQDGSGWIPHSAHWGAFAARWDGKALEVKPYHADPAPSPILDNFRTALKHRARVLRPMVRRSWLNKSRLNKSWLDGSTRHRRSFDSPFVALPWDEALDLLAGELSRVRDQHGAASVYGGSYGWASAGRFHHAQSQIHRFLNIALGGYVRSVNSYSAGASAVILPHVMGNFEGLSRHNVTW
jgi:biotin/methionine sulfoxide reductase